MLSVSIFYFFIIISGMAAKKNIISREGYEKIVMEINELKEVQIPETLEVLKDARAQ